MGREAKCRAVIGRWKGEGKVLLETDDLIFRGDHRLVVPRKEIRSAVAEGDWLRIEYPRGTAGFEVGRNADRWARDILHPKSRIDKMDVKPDSRVAAVAMRDDDFIEELLARATAVASRLGRGPYDLVFYRADQPAALARLETLRDRIEQNGAIWIVTPKGRPELGHGPVVAAAKRAGLVDVKTARYSDTHTALKLVIPKAERL